MMTRPICGVILVPLISLALLVLPVTEGVSQNVCGSSFGSAQSACETACPMVRECVVILCVVKAAVSCIVNLPPPSAYTQIIDNFNLGDGR